MNTIELLRDLSKFVCADAKGRWGVFAADQLPQEKITRPCLVIANNRRSTHSGEHWLGFFFPAGSKRAEFFDSFGRPPKNKSFIKFIKNNSTSFIYNDKKIQGNWSAVCGQYTLLFLYFRCKNRSMRTFLNEFDVRSPDRNDVKIMKMYAKMSSKMHTERQENPTQTGGRYKIITCNQTCKPLKKKK